MPVPNNNNAAVYFDDETAKVQGAAVLQSFTIPDTSGAQEVLLYARLNNNDGEPLADLDASMFDGFNRDVFEAIKQYTGGSATMPIYDVSGLLVYLSSKPAAQEYLCELFKLTPNDMADRYDAIGVNNMVRKGDIEKCRNAVISASNKRKTLDAVIRILMAKDDNECARHARIISHLSNTATGEEFTASQTFERRKYLFSYQGAALAQTHNFYTLMGAQKSGKSHIFAVLLSSVLYGECCGFKYIGDDDPMVLYFDTEQDTTDAQEIIHTANVLNGKPVTQHPRGLRCFTLAHTPREKVFDFIAEKVEYFNPQIIFIDGYGGMVADVNDPSCTGVVNDLRVLAQSKGCSIFGIVHTTPTAAVLKALGVFGSELQRWGAGTFLNEKQEGYFKMSAFELRKGGDVQPFYYRLRTSIVSDGEASPSFEYSELTDQLNRIGKHQNDVEILAIPTPIDADEAEAQETLKALAAKQEKDEKKRAKVRGELQAKFCQLYEGDEVKAMTRADLAVKFASRYGESSNPESNKRSARRKINDAATYGILSFDPSTDTYRYIAPPPPEE